MRIVVFETSADGHRFVYMKLLLPAVAELADHVTVALPADAPQRTEYQQLLAPLADRVSFDPWLPSLKRKAFHGALAKLRLVRQSIARAQADYLIVPHLDGLAQSMGLMRGLRNAIPRHVVSEGLLLRGAFAYPEPSALRRAKKRLSWRLVRHCPMTYMHHLDPIVYEKITRQPDAARWLLMPDPVEQPTAMSRSEARRMLGVPEDGRYVGCAGTLDKRKGVDLLMRAFADAKLADSDRLLLLGPVHAELRPLLDGPYAELVRAGRIIVHDRFFDPQDLGTAMQAMDLVCTFYPDHIGTASIVLRAAAARRPVLASSFGWMGMVVPRMKLGTVCNVRDPDAARDALIVALERAASYEPTEAGRRFSAFHSVENFQTTWTVRLRQTLGLPPAEGQRPWSWVLEAADS